MTIKGNTAWKGDPRHREAHRRRVLAIGPCKQRGLVRTVGAGNSWRVEITDAGREELARGKAAA